MNIQSQRMNMPIVREACLVLADGSVFEGEAVRGRRAASRTGEVVFNTALSGYQEMLTDPSYAGQIITFTNPHIGNYGVNAADFESRRLFCRGVVVRELARRPSNRRAEADLDAMLRALRRSRHHRHRHPPADPADPRRPARVPGAFGPAERLDAVRAAAAAEPGTDGIDLVATVTTRAAVHGRRRRRACAIVAYDYGIKRTILRHLAGLGTVEVVPATTPAADVAGPRARRRSSCPTGPATRPASPAPSDVIARAARPRRARSSASASATSCWRGARRRRRSSCRSATTAPTTRCRTSTTGAIEITSQNHNFAVAADAPGRVADADPRQPQRRRLRGPRRPPTPTPSACSTTPRPAPGPTTAATCSPASPTA